MKKLGAPFNPPKNPWGAPYPILRTIVLKNLYNLSLEEEHIMVWYVA